jgi:2-C-methyl-D-erythritol 4-phosphate cytidylyltransferase/2-C-methyl-D-erythritol 2,4-cyclodiphosphate synthase
MTAALVIVGAGEGTRFGGPVRKALVTIGDRTLVERSAAAFAGVAGIVDRVVVLHPEDAPRAQASGLAARLSALSVRAIVAGGRTRQDSVLAGVRATQASVKNVLVHDAARPFVNPERVLDLLDALKESRAALLAIRPSATVKRVRHDGVVLSTLPRGEIRLATTPQGGRRADLLRLLEDAVREKHEVTDEASLFERAGIPPQAVDDDPTNIKITSPEDLELARGLVPDEAPRVGHGYDIHRLVAGRKLILGGVPIPHDLGLDGHSDADVLLHAVMEAILGAAGMPDIGEIFPDTDPRYRNAASSDMLRYVVSLLGDRSLRVAQIDCSVLAERPKLAPFKPQIAASLRSLLALPEGRVSVKARTNEGLDAVGRGEAIAAHAIAVLVPGVTPPSSVPSRVS